MTTGKKPINLPLTGSETLREAQGKMKPHMKGPGVYCPCCRQLVRVVEKELSQAMAYVLVLMYRHFQTSDDWLDMAQYLENMVAIGSEVKGGEWSKLRYWNLIVERPPEKRTVFDMKPPVKTKGMYRITDAGKRFVLGTMKVPRSVWVYNNKVLEVSKKSVTIRECLGKEFKYEDLMAGKLGSFVV